MLREWEEPRVGGASRRERELRKDAKHPSRSRREAPPTRPRAGCPEGHFGGTPGMARAEIVAPGRFSSSFFGSRTQTGTESAFCAPWRCEGTCQLGIVESAVSLTC